MKSWVVKALKGVNLKVFRGEYLSIMGPSGSGKTTLFNMIGGLDKPTKGEVYVEGRNLAEMTYEELAAFRCFKIGYIFQTFNLIPSLTALDNVMLPMLFAGVPRSERVERAKKLLEEVGLGDRLNHKPDQLSGGQQQRVAIARALANNPSIILADEPTANLDLESGLRIVSLLKRISVDRGVTVICATHDLKMLGVSDRSAWIRDGVIERIELRRSVELTPDELQL
ncbi:MAG: ABC transporter ATP-binding protein [Candidatus Methanomethylicota archaeon]|uniref:ABC transporter ATP-binding protein n=1 Tax=Thermoproteota archaeon TaxID=2056631 RepID=A0A497F3U8_9CREN|nr:MAG: ABC transporter ATP-binding protein [Candidatus Verstraetearchaeota archaeon]